MKSHKLTESGYCPIKTDGQQQTYQLYESTPLAIAEVPKCQPEL
jgi:hypothetical protein